MKRAKSIVPPTKSIPITKDRESTAEELQLKEEEARADYRDLCMYVRIINGMIGRKGQSNVEILNNIVRTRHLPVQDLWRSRYKDDLFDKCMISSLGTTTARCSITISPDELIPYAFDAKDGIPVIIIQSAEEAESREEEIIFVLDL
jgi:hypothetical protein